MATARKAFNRLTTSSRRLNFSRPRTSVTETAKGMEDVRLPRGAQAQADAATKLPPSPATLDPRAQEQLRVRREGMGAPQDTGQARTREERLRRLGTTSAGLGAFTLGRPTAEPEAEAPTQAPPPERTIRGVPVRTQVPEADGRAPPRPTEPTPAEEPRAEPTPAAPSRDERRQELITGIARATATGDRAEVQRLTQALQDIDAVGTTADTPSVTGTLGRGLGGGAMSAEQFEAEQTRIGQAIAMAQARGEDTTALAREMDGLFNRFREGLPPEEQQAFDQRRGEAAGTAFFNDILRGEAEGFGKGVIGVQGDDPDNTDGLMRAHFKGKEFQLGDSSTYPPEFVRQLQEQGIDPESIANAARDKFIADNYGNETDERKAALKAILADNGAHGLYVDDELGIVDENGEPRMTIERAMELASGFAQPVDSTERFVADSVGREYQKQGLSPEAEGDADGIFAQAEQQLREVMDSEPEAIDSTELIESTRARFLNDTARTMRAAVNRASRGGMSAEAVSAMRAEMGQNADIALSQQEALIQFQTEQQNMQARLAWLNQVASVSGQIFAASQNQDMMRAQLAAQNEAARIQQLMQQKANEFNVGNFLAQAGLGILGTVAGAATGALVPALIGGAGAVTGAAAGVSRGPSATMGSSTLIDMSPQARLNRAAARGGFK